MIPVGVLPQVATVEHYDNTGTDPFGNPARTLVGQDDYRCRLDQLRSREDVTGRDTATTDFLLFLPSNAVADPGDEVLVEGRRYRINGAPATYRTFRQKHHVEAILEYVEEVS
jgi:hypothetical protein